MELTVTPPVLVTVTGTIGIGQYGGGVEGKPAVDGVTCRPAGAAVVVVGSAVVGGVVTGGAVGAGT